jgi:hypothetical protein
MNLAIFQHPCLQPAPDQADQARVADSMFDEAQDPLVTQTPEEVLQVRLQHPAHLAARDPLIERGECTMGTQPRPPAEGTRQEVLLVDG